MTLLLESKSVSLMFETSGQEQRAHTQGMRSIHRVLLTHAECGMWHAPPGDGALPVGLCGRLLCLGARYNVKDITSVLTPRSFVFIVLLATHSPRPAVDSLVSGGTSNFLLILSFPGHLFALP